MTYIKNITIPDSVLGFGDYAFYSYNKLTSINIPDSITSIGNYAFYNCTSLTSVTIPSSVTSIGERAFFGCDSLTSITIQATTPPTLGANAFDDTNANLAIYVPAQSVELYKNVTNWSSLASRIKTIE